FPTRRRSAGRAAAPPDPGKGAVSADALRRAAPRRAPRSRSPLHEARGEDTVGAVALRGGAPERFPGAKRCGNEAIGSLELERGMALEKRFHDVHGLLRFQGADTIHHDA